MHPYAFKHRAGCTKKLYAAQTGAGKGVDAKRPSATFVEDACNHFGSGADLEPNRIPENHELKWGVCVHAFRLQCEHQSR